MKKLKWNVGIMIIWSGYRIRGGQDYKHRTRAKWVWFIGRHILKTGYCVRGEIPRGTWKWNHI